MSAELIQVHFRMLHGRMPDGPLRTESVLSSATVADVLAVVGVSGFHARNRLTSVPAHVLSFFKFLV